MAGQESHVADSSLLASSGKQNFIKILYSTIVSGLTHPERIARDMKDVIGLDVQREIFCCSSPKRGATILCNELLKSTHQQWFEIFKEALKKNECMILYKHLSMIDVKNVNDYEKILQNHYSQLINVDPDEVLPALFESHCITKEDLEEIRVEKKNAGKTSAMQKLLLYLPCRNERWLTYLLSAMKKAKYEPLLHNIHPELPDRNSEPSMASVLEKKVINDRLQDEGKSVKSPPTAVAARIIRPPSVESKNKTEIETADTELKRIEREDTAGVETDLKQRDTETTTVKTPIDRETSPKTTYPKQATEKSVTNVGMRSLSQSSQSLTNDVEVDGAELSFDLDLRSGPPIMNIQSPSVFEPKTAAASSCAQSSYTFSPPGQSSPMDASAYDLRTDTRKQKLGVDVFPVTAHARKAKRGSHPGVAPEHLELRGYQQELAADGLRGDNCLVVAPTGSGKTLIALAIAKHVFESADSMADEPKIIFFVPTVALVQQQLDQFLRYMSGDCRCQGLSGEEELKIPFSQLVDVNDVLIVTPQILLNALERKEIESLSVFSLLIFDECHRMNKNHPYNQIMSVYYVDHLLSQNSSNNPPRLPQVVGLTASPGVGQATNHDMAVEHILELCANMAAFKISTVRDEKNLKELDSLVNKPNEETEEVRGRSFDPFCSKISEAMEKIEIHLKTNSDMATVSLDIPDIRSLMVPPSQRGSDPYTQYVSKLKKKIAIIRNQNIRRFYVSCLRHLEVYNNALLINADCRTKDAVNYIGKEFEKLASNQGSLAIDDTDHWLDRLYAGMQSNLRDMSIDPNLENPKLKRLEEKILLYYAEREESLGIVFCKTREMTTALMNWMKESKTLAWLNPHNLVGGNRPTRKDGMTHNKLEDVLKLFKDGQHKVIIATSVAEEGLDVRSCNYVIRYEHVSNDIARVQARGRARAEDAEYCLVAERGRGTIERDEANRVRETMMNRAIDAINGMNPVVVKNKICQLQEKAKVERDMATQGKILSNELRRGRYQEGDYELRCMKCSNLAAWSSDLRVIQKAHHVTLDEDFPKRIKLEPHPRPKKYDDWEKTAKIRCPCGDDWGIKALYKGVPYHVLKAESFVVISAHGQQTQHKKWKLYPFQVEELSLEDMQNMSQRALGGSSKSDST